MGVRERKREREGGGGGGRERQTDRQRMFIYFCINFKIALCTEDFFSNAETGFNEASFLGVMTSYKFVY